MDLSLGDLYRYVYGTAGIIDVTQVPEDKKDRAIAKNKQQIKDRFKVIIQDRSALVFRALLRYLDKKDLEENLYGSSLETINDEVFLFKSEHDIFYHFDLLNKQYKYFSRKSMRDSFVILFRACRLMSFFIEKNGKTDDEIYEQAYKILVLFGVKVESPFSNVENFLRNFCNNQALSDILAHPIPVNEPPISLLNWQNIIADNGSDAIKLFEYAPVIEQLLGKAPDSFMVALDGMAKLTYPRAEENFKLASLCFQYKVKENIFNRCLEIKPKQSDNLPTVCINLTANGKNYYLVKLPADDPHVFLLGEITNCCQKIGRYDDYIIDGITRQNHSFYVILKEKNAHKNREPFIDNKINYENYYIVAQSLAWLSRNGNFTFDGLERLHRSVSDEIITQLLQEFGKQITSNIRSTVLYVTLGINYTKYKPPKTIAKKIVLREKVLDGVDNADAEKQVLIFKNQKKIDCYHHAITSKLKESHQLDLKLNVSGITQIKKIEHLFLNEYNVNKYKEIFNSSVQFEYSYEDFLTLCVSDLFLLDAAFFLHQGNSLTIKNWSLLKELDRQGGIEEVVDAMYLLNQVNLQLVNDKIFSFLVSQAYTRFTDFKPVNYAKTLIILYTTHPTLCNDQTIAWVFNFDERFGNPADLAETFSLLYVTNPTLANNANFEFLFNAKRSLNRAIKNLIMLYAIDPALINDENRSLLSLDHGMPIAKIIAILHSAGITQINDEDRAWLANNLDQITVLEERLTKLKQFNPAALNVNNFKQICEDTYGADFKLLVDDAGISPHESMSEIISESPKLPISPKSNNKVNIAKNNMFSTQTFSSSLLIDRSPPYSQLQQEEEQTLCKFSCTLL